MVWEAAGCCCLPVRGLRGLGEGTPQFKLYDHLPHWSVASGAVCWFPGEGKATCFTVGPRAGHVPGVPQRQGVPSHQGSIPHKPGDGDSDGQFPKSRRPW